MRNRTFILYAILFHLLFIGCEKEEIPNAIDNEVVFFGNGNFNALQFDFEAGNKTYFMHTDYLNYIDTTTYIGTAQSFDVIDTLNRYVGFLSPSDHKDAVKVEFLTNDLGAIINKIDNGDFDTYDLPISNGNALFVDSIFTSDVITISIDTFISVSVVSRDYCSDGWINLIGSAQDTSIKTIQFPYNEVMPFCIGSCSDFVEFNEPDFVRNVSEFTLVKNFIDQTGFGIEGSFDDELSNNPTTSTELTQLSTDIIPLGQGSGYIFTPNDTSDFFFNPDSTFIFLENITPAPIEFTTRTFGRELDSLYQRYIDTLSSVGFEVSFDIATVSDTTINFNEVNNFIRNQLIVSFITEDSTIYSNEFSPSTSDNWELSNIRSYLPNAEGEQTIRFDLTGAFLLSNLANPSDQKTIEIDNGTFAVAIE